MDGLNDIQPIDDYIKSLLKYAKEKYNLNIDPEKPTRAQRLEAALELTYDVNYKDPYPYILPGYKPALIMIGRKLDSGPAQKDLIDKLYESEFIEMWSKKDKLALKKFYNQFAHNYWPNKVKKI